MFTRRLLFVFTSLVLMALLGAACGANPAPSQTATPAQPSRTPAPTRTLTPVPTETSRPSVTPAAGAALNTPSFAASPTPDASLSDVQLLGLSWLPGYNMLLSFQFPGPVEVDQYQVRLEAKEYTCQKLAKYPDRLYCTGPGAKVLTTAWVRVYPAGSDQPGFEQRTWIPYFDNQYINTIGDNNDEDYENFYTR